MSDLFLEGFWDPPNRNMTHIWTEYFFFLTRFPDCVELRTFDDYEEMFYQFAKPLKIHRPLIPMPYRTLTAWRMRKHTIHVGPNVIKNGWNPDNCELTGEKDDEPWGSNFGTNQFFFLYRRACGYHGGKCKLLLCNDGWLGFVLPLKACCACGSPVLYPRICLSTHSRAVEREGERERDSILYYTTCYQNVFLFVVCSGR